ncbi:diheme cytochrome c, partial [Oceanospirillum sp. HFRX-1_2]
MTTLMHKIRWPLGGAMLTGALFIGLSGFAQQAQSSWWGEDHEDEYRAKNSGNPTYLEECGACHIAYPAQLLPKAAWQDILSNLDSHFGEDASVDIPIRDELAGYLSRNASDSTNAGKFRKFTRGIDINTPPIRITELKYFERKHDEINYRKMVLNNPDVGSFSQCQACHEKAEQGI